MFLQESYVKYLIESSTQWTHGVDYLSIRCNTPLMIIKKLSSLIDTNNSNIAYIDNWNTIIYSIERSSRWGTDYYNICASCNLSWVNTPVPIMRITHNYLEHKRQKMSQYLHNIHVYWSAFRLISVWIFDTWLSLLNDVLPDDFNTLIDYAEITRIDYALDFFFDKESNFIPNRQKLVSSRNSNVTDYSQFYKSSSIKKDKKIQEDIHAINLFRKSNIDDKLILNQVYSEWESITWRRMGNPRDKKSNLIRAYDKVMDSIAKNKILLYSDYIEYKVRRIETEFWLKFCVWPEWWYYKLSQIEDLISKAQSFMSVENAKVKYYYEKNTIPQRYLNRAIKAHETSAFKLVKNWINPYLANDNGLHNNGICLWDISQLRSESKFNEIVNSI